MKTRRMYDPNLNKWVHVNASTDDQTFYVDQIKEAQQKVVAEYGREVTLSSVAVVTTFVPHLQMRFLTLDNRTVILADLDLVRNVLRIRAA